MALDDPRSVREQYACDGNLRARRALYEEVGGPDPHEALWRTIATWGPREVLEVGGGPGELAARMQNELGAHVRYVDVSPGMVELARSRGVDARVGDVQDLPFDDGEFDTVVAAWMLYHVADLDRGLAEIARVLRPGGALIAVTNSLRHLSELWELMQYAPAFDFNRENGEEHLRRFFAQVERHDMEIEVTVRERTTLDAYRRSMQVETAPLTDVPLPFVTFSRPTIFFATK